MFRLSNKLVQVTFEDKTEIILSSETREVTYVNKKGERETFPLSSALESTNAEMAKRLTYTKNILTHMLSSASNGNQKEGSEHDKKGQTQKVGEKVKQAGGEKEKMTLTSKGGFKANI